MNKSDVSEDGKKQETRKLRVLIVDDQVESARLMAKNAEGLGHEAAWASTEAEARAILSAQKFDGMVADYSLDPEPVQGGGARLVAMLHSGGKTMPCVIITGFSPAGDLASLVSVLEALVDVVVLHKPQDISSILSILCALSDANKMTVAASGGSN